MPLTINDLSTEVLRCLLSHVKSISSENRDATFLNTLTVCRRWYEIGHELLWTDVSLCGGQLVEFTKCPRPCSGLIRSLTIKVPTHTIDYADQPIVTASYSPHDIFTALQLLPRNLKLMNKLESFSFVVLDHEFRYRAIKVHPKVLLEILLALPQSLRHLEFDTNHLESSASRERVHLCPILRQLMARLCNSRLRLRSLCKDLFHSPVMEPADRGHESDNARSPTTRTIIISTVTRSALDELLSCAPVPQLGFSLAAMLGLPPIHALQEVILSAQHAIQKWRQRDSMRLAFFQSKDPDWRDDLRFGTFSERTLLPQEKVRKSPFQHGGQGRKSFLRYKAGNGDLKDLCGDFEDLESIVEGRTWVETVEGYQIPHAYYRSESRFSTSCLKKLSVVELDQAETDTYGSLFRIEKREGRKLLFVEESEDLQDVNVLQRDLTREELDYKAELEAQENGFGIEGIEEMILRRFDYGSPIHIPTTPVMAPLSKGPESDPDPDLDDISHENSPSSAVCGGGLFYLEDGIELAEAIEGDFDERAKDFSLEEKISAFNRNMTATGVLTLEPSMFREEDAHLSNKERLKWLVANYEAGDVVSHLPYNIHSAGANQDSNKCIRLSTDLRFHDKKNFDGETIDKRWMKYWTPGDGL